MIPKYKNVFISWQFYGILKEAVKMADIKENEKILDFGCGEQQLKQILPSTCIYFGYDKKPKLNSINSYTNLGIHTVFSLNVFEHLSKKELRNILKSFKRMKVKKVVIAIPNGRWINKFFEFIFNWDAENLFEHQLEPKEIAKILVQELGLPIKIKRYNLTQYLAVFERGGA